MRGFVELLGRRSAAPFGGPTRRDDAAAIPAGLQAVAYCPASHDARPGNCGRGLQRVARLQLVLPACGQIREGPLEVGIATFAVQGEFFVDTRQAVLPVVPGLRSRVAVPWRVV